MIEQFEVFMVVSIRKLGCVTKTTMNFPRDV